MSHLPAHKLEDRLLLAYSSEQATLEFSGHTVPLSKLSLCRTQNQKLFVEFLEERQDSDKVSDQTILRSMPTTHTLEGSFSPVHCRQLSK